MYAVSAITVLAKQRTLQSLLDHHSPGSCLHYFIHPRVFLSRGISGRVARTGNTVPLPIARAGPPSTLLFACISGPRLHRAFSLSELPPGVELQTICLKLPWLGTFEVEACVLSTWRASVDASAESAGVTG